MPLMILYNSSFNVVGDGSSNSLNVDLRQLSFPSGGPNGSGGFINGILPDKIVSARSLSPLFVATASISGHTLTIGINPVPVVDTIVQISLTFGFNGV